MEPETPYATGRRTRRALGDCRHLPPRRTEGQAAVSEGSELSPEDVKEILRLIDESEFDEVELETPRFSLRFSRRGAGPAREPTPTVLSGLVDVPAPSWAPSTTRLPR